MSDRSESAMELGPGFCRAGRQQSQASGARRLWPALSILVLGALGGLKTTTAQALDVPPGFDGFQFATPYSMHNPFSKDDLRKIDDGFKLFTTEKFKGNGRVCASCHIPERGYNISAGDMDRLKHKEAEQALGGSNLLLENDEILQKLALFNINQTFGPESAGATTAPAAESSRAACPLSTRPMRAIRSPCIATSAFLPDAPVPSTTIPPRIARSKMRDLLLLVARC